MSEVRVVASPEQSNLKVLYKMISILMSVVVLLAIFVFFYMKHPQFAELPQQTHFTGRLTASYENGLFYNQLPTPVLTRVNEKSQVAALMEFVFSKDENAKPLAALPSVKTNLHQLNPHENEGHNRCHRRGRCGDSG